MDDSRRKKITIVGGGIIGCLVAIHFRKKKYDVTILEQKKFLGGILRDYKIKDDFFLRGCQYLENGIDWIDQLKDISNIKFNNFKYNYASYNIFNNEILFQKGIAVPIFKIKEFSKKNFKLDNIKNISLNDKVSLYPREIKKKLTHFIKNCGLNPKKIHYNCAQNLQISRINIFNSDKKLIDLKKTKLIFDQNLAVSRKVNNQNQLYYSTPLGGYSNLFDNILKNLKKIGVKVILNTKVEPVWVKNKLTLKYDKKHITDSLMFWSGNPTNLIYNFNKKKLQSNIFKTFQINANINSNYGKNFFLQNFSDKSKILRIQTYTLNKKKKIGIECILTSNSVENLIDETSEILQNLKIDLKILKKTLTKFPLPRFDVYTVSDQKIINDFQIKTKNSNLLYSPWLIYGREKKIEKIIDFLISKKIY